MPTGSGDESQLLAAIKRGDEDAFAEIVERYNASMLRVARLYVATKSVAEDVVQETWLAVIQGIHRFEGRSSFKTWLFTVLTNRAKTRGQREGRVIPMSSYIRDSSDPEAAVDPSRFTSGEWNSLPAAVPPDPSELVQSKELGKVVETAVRKLPDTQREVITLRDIEGLPAEDVCDLLGITDGNQRVLLHRARSRVRTAVESYLAGGLEAAR